MLLAFNDLQYLIGFHIRQFFNPAGGLSNGYLVNYSRRAEAEMKSPIGM
jgi:hypothetical protein